MDSIIIKRSPKDLEHEVDGPSLLPGGSEGWDECLGLKVATPCFGSGMILHEGSGYAANATGWLGDDMTPVADGVVSITPVGD